MELTVGGLDAAGTLLFLGEAIAAFVLIALLLAACLVASLVLVISLGVMVSPRGTVLGAVVSLAVLVVVSSAVDAAYGLLAAIGAAILGIAVGRLLWPDAAVPTAVEHPLYRLVLLGIGAPSIAAGLGLWAYLLSVGGTEFLALSLSAHPREAVNLVVVTGLPVVLGVGAIAMATRRRSVGDRRQPA